ncbi:MAG: phosphatase PAP2 family protein [Woeseiaceae bacterium]|nr:phosphatase PAP2 family protein [Woeseiaceae bacterium]
MQPGMAWLSVAVLALLGLHAETAAAESGDLLAGDIVTVLTPLTAFGIAYFKDDVEGQKQWLRDTGLALVVNTTIRVAFNQTSLGERPDGGSYGFPSGHAGFMFSQAGFLQERYGWRYGVPALALATGVSYIRVREDKHYWRDVITGGAVGYGVALITVTPENAIQVAPVFGPDWLGIRFSRSF